MLVQTIWLNHPKILSFCYAVEINHVKIELHGSFEQQLHGNGDFWTKKTKQVHIELNTGNEVYLQMLRKEFKWSVSTSHLLKSRFSCGVLKMLGIYLAVEQD